MKTDANQLPYYDKLPDGFRVAKIDDFHENGRKKIGMEFLIKRIIQDNFYEAYTVNENLTGTWLKQFIDDKRVFVKN